MFMELFGRPDGPPKSPDSEGPGSDKGSDLCEGGLFCSPSRALGPEA